MSISTKLYYASHEDLHLDSKNPRLGRHNTAEDLAESAVLELMQDWTLDELAVSFIESGFWLQEALLVVKEKGRFVVIEGNRRLAAIKLLFEAKAGACTSRNWADLATKASTAAMRKLENIPYLLASTRKEVHSYLGFRHVSGIMEWKPAEKAEFIARLIEEEGLDYDTVRRRIGSKADAVRRHYIAYSLLRQMESVESDIDLEKVEKKFSVLYLSLRTAGVRDYLEIDIQASPNKAKRPVLKKNFDKLTHYARWLFGHEGTPAIFTDSRKVDRFGKILQSEKAVTYLENTKKPSFELAYRKAGGDLTEVATRIETAADEIEEALSTVHHHVKSPRVTQAVDRLMEDIVALLKHFPDHRNMFIVE